MIRKALIEDAGNMEDACSRLANRQDIWQDRIIYWICVAVLHLLQAEIRRIDGAKQTSV